MSCVCVCLCALLNTFVRRVCDLLCDVVWHGCFSGLDAGVYLCVFVVLSVCAFSVNYCVILYGFVLVCFCDCGWLCVC